VSRRLIEPLLLVFLAVAAHAWELNGAFVFDDIPYILLNPQVQRGLGADWWRFLTDPTAYSSLAATVHYRPLVALSYAFDAGLGWGTVPYKLTQLALHLVTVLALYGALRLARRHVPAVPATVPLLAAGWMAVAPFNVEAVHYMAARSSLLCGAFAACALALYLAMRLQTRPLAALGLYGAHLAAVGAALLSKETALALPAAMLAADLLLVRHREGRRALVSWRLWWPYVPYAAGLAVALAVMPNVEHAFGHLRQVLGSEWRLAAAFHCLVENVRLMVFPTGLTVVHPIDTAARVTGPATLANAALVLAVLGWAWAARRRAPLLAFGWIWYLLLIAPSTFVHLNVVLLENRGYAAALGVGMVLASLAGGLWRAAPARRRAVVAGLVCAAVLLTAVSAWRERVWASNEALWEDAVAGNPTHAGARLNRALVRLDAGRAADAERDLRRALDLDPTLVRARYALAQALTLQGRPGEALNVLAGFGPAAADDPRLFLEVARARLRQDDPDAALDALRRLAGVEAANARNRKYEYPYAPAATATEIVRVALQAGRPADARWAVDHLRREAPDDPRADVLDLRVDAAVGDWAGAAAALDRLERRLPGDPRLVRWRAQLQAARRAAGQAAP
jgi:tetratricopeptide (TPR) repeat protein